MLKLLKLILSLVWITITIICLLLSINLFNKILIPNIDSFVFLFYGVVCFIIVNIVLPKRSFEFWDTFFHELDHILFMLLTFSVPLKLMVSPAIPENGANGYVMHSGSSNTVIKFIRDHLVNLAPYFFSPLTLLLIGIYCLILFSSPYLNTIYISKSVLNSLLFLIGFTYTYHLKTSFSQAKPYQTDFSIGYRYGMIFVIMMQSIFFTLFFFVLTLTYDSTYIVRSYLFEIINYIDLYNMDKLVKLFYIFIYKID